MNTIRELKQQEKYKTMLKRKNKEKKIYKDKNASLQFEKQKLYRALLNREREIERLNYIINELEKWLKEQHQFIIEIPAYTKEISIEHKAMEICYENVLDKLQELKGSNGTIPPEAIGANGEDGGLFDYGDR